MERSSKSIAGAFWYVTRESYNKSLEWQQKYGKTVKSSDPVVYGRDWYVDSSNRKIGVRTYNPYDYMIKEWAPSMTQNLSVSGKTKNTTYNIGLGYLGENGMMKPAKHASLLIERELLMLVKRLRLSMLVIQILMIVLCYVIPKCC